MSISEILRDPVSHPRTRESVALVVGAAAFVIGLIVALIAFGGNSVAIAGRGSLGQVVAISAAVAAAAVFVMARVLVRVRLSSDDHLRAQLRWYDTAALALAYAAIALLGWLGIATLMDKSFTGAVVFTFSAIVLAAVALALTAWAVFLSAVSLTPVGLSVVLCVFLVIGCLTSMLSASDADWWKDNLSALGMADDFSARTFNVTLVIGGVIVTTIAHFATEDLATSTARERHGRTFVRIALGLIGVLLACVGLFPVDEHFLIHNSVACGMVVAFITTIIGLRWFVPSTPPALLALGYIYALTIVTLAVFFAVGYYTLTAVELVAFVLVFSWLIVFLRNTTASRSQRQG